MIFLVGSLSLSGNRGGETVLRTKEGIIIVPAILQSDGNIPLFLSLLTALILLVFSLH